ncbi:MAG: response regulator, partial [Verrucomicrobia bacterium]|nr:response regulator [Verrucomicrobiota bacterium]
MPTENYSRAVVIWADDRFAGLSIDEADVWRGLFGPQNDHVFRMMDLYIEVVTTAEGAVRALERHGNASGHGTFVIGILDLCIPRRSGTEPSLKYGISVAKEFRRRGLHFVFLSANTDASSVLGQEKLGTVPYYIKEPGMSPWRLPDPLVTMLLGELRTHVCWVTIESVIAALHRDSDVVFEDYTQSSGEEAQFAAYRSFPFFGSYRDFVQRCEHRGELSLDRSFYIRSHRDHCDQFVMQCLLVLLNQVICANRGRVRISFGHVHDARSVARLRRHMVADETGCVHVSVLRVVADLVSAEAFAAVLDSVMTAVGLVIFVVPNDESADRYTELLRNHRVSALEELPQDRLTDGMSRETLLRRACMLTIQNWAVSGGSPVGLASSADLLSYPELLFNPIDWAILLDADRG